MISELQEAVDSFHALDELFTHRTFEWGETFGITRQVMDEEMERLLRTDPEALTVRLGRSAGITSSTRWPGRTRRVSSPCPAAMRGSAAICRQALPESPDGCWGSHQAFVESPDGCWGSHQAFVESPDGCWGSHQAFVESPDGCWGSHQAFVESPDACWASHQTLLG